MIILHPDGGNAAFLRYVLCGVHIVAAETDLYIGTADKLLPFCLGIAVLELGDRLNHKLTEDVGAPAHLQNALEVHQLSDIAELLQTHVDPDRQAAVVSIAASVFHQAGKELGEKQGA